MIIVFVDASGIVQLLDNKYDVTFAVNAKTVSLSPSIATIAHRSLLAFPMLFISHNVLADAVYKCIAK